MLGEMCQRLAESAENCDTERQRGQGNFNISKNILKHQSVILKYDAKPLTGPKKGYNCSFLSRSDDQGRIFNTKLQVLSLHKKKSLWVNEWIRIEQPLLTSFNCSLFNTFIHNHFIHGVLYLNVVFAYLKYAKELPKYLHNFAQ